WLIAERLARYPNAQLATILRPATDWLQDTSAKLSKDCLPVFDRILRKLAGVRRESPNEGRSGILRSSQEPDWTMEALYSPTRTIAQALYNDPRKANLNRNPGLPSDWPVHADALLALPNDVRRHATVILFHTLNVTVRRTHIYEPPR